MEEHKVLDKPEECILMCEKKCEECVLMRELMHQLQITFNDLYFTTLNNRKFKRENSTHILKKKLKLLMKKYYDKSDELDLKGEILFSEDKLDLWSATMGIAHEFRHIANAFSYMMAILRQLINYFYVEKKFEDLCCSLKEHYIINLQSLWLNNQEKLEIAYKKLNEAQNALKEAQEAEHV